MPPFAIPAAGKRARKRRKEHERAFDALLETEPVEASPGLTLDGPPWVRLPWRQMTSVSRTWGWAWRTERGGSVAC